MINIVWIATSPGSSPGSSQWRWWRN